MNIQLRDVDNCIINESAILEGIDSKVDNQLSDLFTEAVIQAMISSENPEAETLVETAEGVDVAYSMFLNEAAEYMTRDGILHEGSTFILDADAKTKKAVSIEVLRMAKENNDADYTRLIKFNMLRKKQKQKLFAKYGARAEASVRRRATEIRKSSRVSTLIDKFNKQVKNK